VNVKHSAGNPDWMTPGEGQPIDYLALIRECLGGRIEFDPFSSHVANKHVKARLYFTPEQDGFKHNWVDYAHVNPPGLQVKKAWTKLCDEIVNGRVSRAMWTGFSVEQLCILADPNVERWVRGYFYPMDFSTVILRKRISFVREDGTTGSPAHGNYITGIGVNHATFVRLFGPLGQIVKGPLATE
jgi:hypothetical protein